MAHTSASGPIIWLLHTHFYRYPPGNRSCRIALPGDGQRGIVQGNRRLIGIHHRCDDQLSCRGRPIGAISICYLVVKGLLQTQSDGTTKLMDFLDEQRMHRLYEKFILEYYRREFPQITANASQIPWQLDNDIGALLPVMQTDIMLSQGEKTLIIDAKYYSHSTQIQYDKHTLHSGNLYQIFTYVKNKDAELANKPHEVSGMLLYAKTDEELYPENEYRMSGNRIEVRTLNLEGDFASIKEQLDGIAGKYFGISAA